MLGVLPILVAASLAASPSQSAQHGAHATAAPAAATDELGRGIDAVELVDDAGKRVRWGVLKGKPRAVFFGFTRCPVVCPVTVWEIDTALAAIGKPADALQINFVTLDPARDTPETMREYFSSFKPRLRALTGSQAAIAQIAKSFEVVHEKVPLDGGDYTLDHTAAVFLIDETGRVVDVLAHGTPQEVMIKRLKQVLRLP